MTPDAVKRIAEFKSLLGRVHAASLYELVWQIVGGVPDAHWAASACDWRRPWRRLAAPVGRVVCAWRAVGGDQRDQSCAPSSLRASSAAGRCRAPSWRRWTIVRTSSGTVLRLVKIGGVRALVSATSRPEGDRLVGRAVPSRACCECILCNSWNDVCGVAAKCDDESKRSARRACSPGCASPHATTTRGGGENGHSRDRRRRRSDGRSTPAVCCAVGRLAKVRGDRLSFARLARCGARVDSDRAVAARPLARRFTCVACLSLSLFRRRRRAALAPTSCSRRSSVARVRTRRNANGSTGRQVDFRRAPPAVSHPLAPARRARRAPRVAAARPLDVRVVRRRAPDRARVRATTTPTRSHAARVRANATDRANESARALTPTPDLESKTEPCAAAVASVPLCTPVRRTRHRPARGRRVTCRHAHARRRRRRTAHSSAPTRNETDSDLTTPPPRRSRAATGVTGTRVRGTPPPPPRPRHPAHAASPAPRGARKARTGNGSGRRSALAPVAMPCERAAVVRRQARPLAAVARRTRTSTPQRPPATARSAGCRAVVQLSACVSSGGDR